MAPHVYTLPGCSLLPTRSTGRAAIVILSATGLPSINLTLGIAIAFAVTSEVYKFDFSLPRRILRRAFNRIRWSWSRSWRQSFQRALLRTRPSPLFPSYFFLSLEERALVCFGTTMGTGFARIGDLHPAQRTVGPALPILLLAKVTACISQQLYPQLGFHDSPNVVSMILLVSSNRPPFLSMYRNVWRSDLVWLPPMGYSGLVGAEEICRLRHEQPGRE